jgi:hypothetical protein
MALMIAEELLLLALDDDGRARTGRTELSAGLGGALLVELALLGSVDLDGKRVVVRRGGPVPGTAVLADARTEIGARQRTPKRWVDRLGKTARGRVQGSLVERGVLRGIDHRLLGLIPSTRAVPADPAARDEVYRRLARTVLDGERPDERTGALAALVHAARLGRRLFPDADRRAVRARLAELAEGDWAAGAVRDAIRSAHAATAAITAAAASSAAAGS